MAEEPPTPPPAVSSYDDRFCRLSGDCLTINNYYFPSFDPREISCDQIRSVVCCRQADAHHACKSWGQERASGVWWAKDMGRRFRSHPDEHRNVVLELKGTAALVGFSVERVDAFLAALRPLLHANATVKRD